MANTLTNEAHQRSLKDFLTLYNTITEYCFNKCISNFNERSASGNETFCIDTCTDNYVQFNQRFMYNFVDHQERRKREQENAVIEAAKQAEAAQAVQAEQLPPTEQLTPAQEEQVMKAAQLLEGLSTGKPDSSSSVDAYLHTEGSGSGVENSSWSSVNNQDVLSQPQQNSTL